MKKLVLLLVVGLVLGFGQTPELKTGKPVKETELDTVPPELKSSKPILYSILPSGQHQYIIKGIFLDKDVYSAMLLNLTGMVTMVIWERSVGR